MLQLIIITPHFFVSICNPLAGLKPNQINPITIAALQHDQLQPAGPGM